MNKETFLQQVEHTLDTMQSLIEAKNADYAGDSDPFKNFKLCESLGICSAEQGLLVRMSDKMSRLSTLIDGPESRVDNESIADTLLDLANYAVLLRVWMDRPQDIKWKARSKGLTDVVVGSAKTHYSAYMGEEPIVPLEPIGKLVCKKHGNRVCVICSLSQPSPS